MRESLAGEQQQQQQQEPPPSPPSPPPPDRSDQQQHGGLVWDLAAGKKTMIPREATTDLPKVQPSMTLHGTLRQDLLVDHTM
nr:NEDD4-binding protein 2-like 1 [Cherax quadricarinatus]